jgi:hypothetical protein
MTFFLKWPFNIADIGRGVPADGGVAGKRLTLTDPAKS